jgi:hypothetical protein
MCCNPAKGRVEFVDGWLIKSSFLTKDEMKACQLTWTKIQQQRKKKKKNKVFAFSPLKILAFLESRMKVVFA